MKEQLLEKITKHKLWIILLTIFAVRIVVYNLYWEFSIYPDTSSYVDFGENILKGEVNATRTPVYPYIIKIISMFSKEGFKMYKNITFIQEIVSIISVIILYKTLKSVLKNRKVTIITTLIYGCLPSIFTYNRVILTESLSISFLVMYFCLIIKYLEQPTNAKTMFIGVFTFLLIMLRPSFLYLLIALALIFLLIFIYKKEFRKQAILGAGVLACVCVLILGYSYLNKRQNDIFAISNVTQINQLDTIIGMGIYQTGDAQDQGIIDIIEEKQDGEETPWYRKTTNKIMANYSFDEIDSYLKRCIKSNFGIYLEKTIQKALDISAEHCDQIYLLERDEIIIKPMIYFIVIYLYLIVEIINIIKAVINRKALNLETIAMFLFIAGQLATIILGAQAEYSRLFISVLPIVIVSIASHIDKKLDKTKYITEKNN